MKGNIKKKMNRRLKPCCCCSQEQMSCDLLWPCKISLGIWTDFNRLFIENFFGEKNLNEMFFFLQMFLRERCVVRASLAALLWTHPQPEWRWTHTHTHLFSQLYSCLLFPWRQKLSCCQRLISWQAPSTAKTLASPTAEKCSRWCHAGCSHVHF